MPLQTWDILAPSLLEEVYSDASSFLVGREGAEKGVTVPMAICRYRQRIIDPSCPLSVYTTPLQRLEDCLVYLSIDDIKGFEPHELFSLCTVPHLAVLELLEPDPTSNVITDRLIRGWHEVGKKQQVFPSLRVLKISSNAYAVMEESLHHVLMFPALEIFDITADPDDWCNAKEVARNYGWRVTKPKGPVFVEYARVYLKGLVKVKTKYLERLREVFADDTQEVTLVDDPRRVTYEEWKEKQPADCPGEERERANPDFSSYLDDGWRALLQGSHPLSATTDAQAKAEDMLHNHPSMTEDQVFWFLALLAQKKYDPAFGIQAQAEGITLPRERFVSIRLCHDCHPRFPSGLHPVVLSSDRLIFSRRRVGIDEGSSERAAVSSMPPRKEPHHEPAPSWAPRQDDRKTTGFKPRKRQRTTADLLSSFGTPSGTSG
jgi:hypothetical protein